MANEAKKPEFVLIRKTTDGLLIIPAIDTLADKQTRLLPGVNQVPAKLWDARKSALAWELESGVLVEVDTKGSDFQDLPLDIQKKLIADCVDLELLANWGRLPKVFQSSTAPLINEQIEKIKKGDNVGV